jgi:ABC-type sugar transport system permease subunit
MSSAASTGEGPALAARARLAAPWRWGAAPSLARAERRTAWAMVTPTILAVLAVALVPVLAAAYLSLHHATISQTGGFAGLANYSALFSDPAFTEALKYTAIFTVLTVAIEFAIAMPVALVLHRRFRGRGALRALVLIPWAFPLAIAAVLARLMLQDPFGLVQYWLGQIGLVHGPILSNTTGLLLAIVAVDVWTSTPFVALLLLAGLQTIPEELHEAARVDGATSVQLFFRITLPLLRPAILVAALFRTLQAWAAFDLFWVMAGRNIDSLSTYVYQGITQTSLNFAPATAAAVFTFASALAIALLFIKGFGAKTVQRG